MNVKIMTGALLLAWIGAGCVGTPVHFADAPMDKLDLARGHKVIGKASSLQLFDVIPIGVNSRQARAYERMKNEAPFEHLTDIKVQDSWKYVIIGFKYSTIITATSYPVKGTTPPPSDQATQTLKQKLEDLVDAHNKGLLTDAEYEAARKKALGL